MHGRLNVKDMCVYICTYKRRDRGSKVVKVLCYKSEGRWFDPSWCHWSFSLTSHNGPGVDSASNRNEYQEHFLGGKGGRCVRLTTVPPSRAVVMKSGNLKFPEPSGPVKGLLLLQRAILHDM